MSSWKRKAVLLIAVLVPPAPASADTPPIELSVDLSEVGRRIVHATAVLPAKAGPLTLYYPKWIPGTHGPIGPVGEKAGLRTSAAGKPLPWKRDDEDPYAYHFTVPEGAGSVTVSFDLVLQPAKTGGVLGLTLTAASPKLAVLNWNDVVVYPKGDGAMTRPVRASVRLPVGWKFGTALTTRAGADDRAWFAVTPLAELIDSPVLCGEYLKELPVGPSNGPKHRVVLACDSEAGLEASPELKRGWDNLVVEAGRLFGVRHYRAYTFLVALSEQTGAFALEHHECSDNRLPERALITPKLWKASADTLPHEYVHSWNGKFRRPAEMIVPDYQRSQRTRLLWVYEGLTNYLGWVLAARSGLWAPEEAREALALCADRMSSSRGRLWRPLDDTAAANFLLLSAPAGWTSYRRSLDYYDEGTLIWLEADVMIRQMTKGKKSLDDFCRLFHGGAGGKPSVSGYRLDDVAAALNKVAPHDWKAHLTRRVSLPNEAPPLGGITVGGWRLTYAEKPGALFETAEGWPVPRGMNLAPSIGLLLAEGKVTDVVPDCPAAKAGVAPGMRLVAVNGRKFSDDGLKAAIVATKKTGKLELLTETGEFFKTHVIEYKGGPRYPTLERGKGPDVLAEIQQPLGRKSER
jgi:predicted metalloprotease with PDZ domain